MAGGAEALRKSGASFSQKGRSVILGVDHVCCDSAIPPIGSVI